MTRILFVDDQPSVLSGLRDMLWRKRREWEMEFVGSGEEALKQLAERAFDIVVSDMRMPSMDGATLLAEVREIHPRVVRIILSGHAELDAAMRAVPVAHQFLAKPCKPALLIGALERAANLQRLVAQPEIQSVLGRIHKLPSAPGSCLRLNQVLSDERADVRAIAAVLERDVAMCAKLLQLVNSAFFGLRNHVTRVDHAVSLLGIDIIRALALCVELFGSPPPPALAALWNAAQQHSLHVAELARRIASSAGHDSGAAFLCGMLHEIGQLVLVAQAEDGKGDSAQWVDAAAAHPEIGGYLLGLWGFDEALVDAVAHHHAPARAWAGQAGLLVTLHVADGLVRECGGPLPFDADAPLDEAFLEQAGVLPRLPAWRALATEIVGPPVAQARPAGD